jgi:uncharacterized MAPEG superfamily protein
MNGENNALDDDVTKGAQLTVIFTLLYSFTFVNVLVTKKRLLKQCEAAKEQFDRYSSPQMRPADRLQAHFLEWSPMFLGLVWSLAATSNLTPVLPAAQLYLGLRALYIVLILRFGVATNGLSKPLWASTFPAYACLLYMAQDAIRMLLL